MGLSKSRPARRRERRSEASRTMLRPNGEAPVGPRRTRPGRPARGILRTKILPRRSVGPSADPHRQIAGACGLPASPEADRAPRQRLVQATGSCCNCARFSASLEGFQRATSARHFRGKRRPFRSRVWFLRGILARRWPRVKLSGGCSSPIGLRTCRCSCRKTRPRIVS